MVIKRKALLADELLVATSYIYGNKSWFDRRRDSLRTAKKFVLDEAATKYLAEMIRDYPRIIADAQDFAIPPFRNMWIEMPYRLFYETVTGEVAAPDSDAVVGYLFDGPLVVAAAGNDGDDAAYPLFYPIEYVLHREMSEREQRDVAEQMGASRIGLDAFFWGSTTHKWTGNSSIIKDQEEAPEGWDKEGLRALRANHTVRMPIAANSQAPTEYFAKIAWSSAGELRNIVALLLFLNRTQEIQTIVEYPHGTGKVGKKIGTRVKHNVVSLKIDPRPKFKRLVATHTGLHRRLHDVRGHFCHDKKAWMGCQHGEFLLGDFGDWWTEYEPLKWKCTTCGGKRWWRNSHLRGSQEEGLAKSQYAVTK